MPADDAAACRMRQPPAAGQTGHGRLRFIERLFDKVIQ
jgi:hypothetical protein